MPLFHLAQYGCSAWLGDEARAVVLISWCKLRNVLEKSGGSGKGSQALKCAGAGSMTRAGNEAWNSRRKSFGSWVGKDLAEK